MIRHDADIQKHYAVIANTPPDENSILHMSIKDAANRVAVMDPSDAGALMEKLDAGKAAEILVSMEPDEAAHVMDAMDPDKASDILEEMDAQHGAAIMAAMDPSKAADILDKMDVDKSAELLLELPFDKAAELLGLMDCEKAGTVLLHMGLDQACAVLNAMDPEAAGDVLETLPSAQAAEFVLGLAPGQMGAVLNSMEADTVGAMLSVMTDADAAGALANMSASSAGRAILNVDPDKAASMLTELEASSAAKIMESISAEEAGSLLTGVVDTAAAGRLLASMKPSKGAAVMLVMEQEQALGILAGAARSDPVGAAAMLGAMETEGALGFFMLLSVEDAASILNEMAPRHSGRLAQTSYRYYKGETSTGLGSRKHVALIMAAMHIHATAALLTVLAHEYRDIEDVAAILLGFPKGLGEWDNHEKIPTDNTPGSRPLQWLQSQGLGSKLLLDMDPDNGIELMEFMQKIEKRRVNAMLNEADVSEMAQKLTAMAQSHQFATLARYIQYSDLNDQAKWMAHMDHAEAGKFLKWQWEEAKEINLMLALENHDRDIILDQIRRTSKLRGRVASIEAQHYEYAVREEEAERRKRLKG